MTKKFFPIGNVILNSDNISNIFWNEQDKKLEIRMLHDTDGRQKIIFFEFTENEWEQLKILLCSK